jgi:lipopolysaccharide biosynthesis regulator YciM
VVKDDLLGQLMTAYTQVPDIPKAIDAADRLLKDDPNNLRALTIEVYLKKAQADQTTDPAAKQALLDDAAARAQLGLNATKPIGMAMADFNKRHHTSTVRLRPMRKARRIMQPLFRTTCWN